MRNVLLIPLLKLFITASKGSKLGVGSTWPGHIMLWVNPSFIQQFDKKFKGKVIVIAGTNGKTTTSKMIRTVLEESGQKVIHNEAGANLLNGVASAIVNASLSRKTSDTAIFEVDENTLPLLLHEITPDILVILNLFRDQLDRYGEVNTIARKWQAAIANLPKETQLLLNADDPHIAFLGNATNASVSYFGIDDKSLFVKERPHAMDATFCPQCGTRLTFEGIYLGHLGIWHCGECKFARPKVVFDTRSPILAGVYNIYNVEAALLIARKLRIENEVVDKALKRFTPAFGRQEEFVVDVKKIKILLSKNPTGFNESLRTIRELKAKQLLLVLNDRIPDGRDISWIWDVDFEDYIENMDISVSGDRCYDMALRIKYALESQKSTRSASSGRAVKSQNDNSKVKRYGNLREAIEEASKESPKSETLYILPTYSAMLEVRKILTGRKLL